MDGDPDMASRLLIPPDPKLGARLRALEQRSWRGGGVPDENININPGAYASACCLLLLLLMSEESKVVGASS